MVMSLDFSKTWSESRSVYSWGSIHRPDDRWNCQLCTCVQNFYYFFPVMDFYVKTITLWNGDWWCYGYEMGKLIKSRIKERMSSRRKPRPVPRENGDRVFLSPHCLLQQIAEPTGSISACTTQHGMEFG